MVDCTGRILRDDKRGYISANADNILLAEYGVTIPLTLSQLRKNIPYVLEDAENDLTTVSREFIHDMYLELLSIDEKILVVEKKSESLLNTDENYHRLQTIPGFGSVISRALLCA